MKMISSTNITSISGVTLMSALTAARALVADRATGLRRLLRLEFLREDRAAELRPDALDQIVDQLLRGVRHLDGEEVDLGREVVVEPDRRNGDDETERGRDQRFRDTGGYGPERAATPRCRHAGKRVHDTHHRAQQTDERRRRAGRRQDAEAALQLGRDDEDLALYRALHRVDVGRGDRGAVPQQGLHFGERLTDDARHVALLLFLGELDRAVQLLLLQEAGELGREPPRLPLRPHDLVQLLEGARPRVDGHRRQDDDDGLGEQTHRYEQVVERETHSAEAPLGSLLFEPEVDRNLNQHADRPAVHARRPEQRFGNVALGRLVEPGIGALQRSEEHTSELQSQSNLVCRLLLEKKKDPYDGLGWILICLHFY